MGEEYYEPQVDELEEEFGEDPPMTPEDLEEQQLDSEEDRLLLQNQLQEGYGSPSPVDLQNQHTFLHKAAFANPDTLRTTFLTEYELGRPLFSIRFLLDLEDISKHYLDDVAKELKVNNLIAIYFGEKRMNVTDSGMSNKGFSMNLNVTRRMDTTRKRLRQIPKEITGGKKRKGGI